MSRYISRSVSLAVAIVVLWAMVAVASWARETAKAHGLRVRGDVTSQYQPTR